MTTLGPDQTEFASTDASAWEIGPYHAGLPGPMRLRLRHDGEVIVSAEVETGFLHRGLEKSFELRSWPAALAGADHLDPEGAVFGELAFCLAVEEIGGIVVPPRAERIRVILSELGRISSHMGFVVRTARTVGADTMVHYVLRDRERILDLFELLTGARFSLNFLRFGGVRADVTEGFIERVLEACELIRIRIKEYNDLFTFNHAFIARTAKVGILTAEQITACGVTGPNARASGIDRDARKEAPYLGYEQLDFEAPLGRGEGGGGGDAHDRVLVRLREISQSVEILKQAVEGIPSGEFLNPQTLQDYREYSVPPGEAYRRIEGARGLLGCHVVSDGGRFPNRVQFRTPTAANLLLISELVVGLGIEDLPVVLASLDLGIAEADR